MSSPRSAAIAYLFTPLTAAGPEGDPTAFTTNLRYASPALALGSDAARRRPRCARTPPALADRRPRRCCCWSRRSRSGTSRATSGSATSSLGAIGLAFFLVLVPVGDRTRRPAGSLGGAVVGPPSLALAAVVGDRLAEERRLRQRPLPGLDRAQRLPDRHQVRARLVQPRRPPRPADRRRRRPARLQAVRLLRRRPLQPRPVRRPPRPARRLPADRERGRAEAAAGRSRARQASAGNGAGPQRGRTTTT